MNIIFPTILILSSIVIFFMYIDPVYQGTTEEKGIKQLLLIKNDFLEKASDISQINKTKSELNDQYNLISINNLKRIKKLLPEHMDNVKLIVDIQRIGFGNGNSIRMGNISLSKTEDNDNNNGEIVIIENQGYNSAILNFSFTTNYSSFKKFIQDLHKSLRLVDIVSVSLTKESEGRDNTSGLNRYKFDISLRTYWLNNNLK